MGNSLATIGSGLTAFFGWWFGELGAMTPGFLRRPFRRSGGALIVDVSGGGIVVRRTNGRSAAELGRVANNPADPAAEVREVARLIGRARRGGLDKVLRLPEGNALRRALDLPLAAAENLREVLTFEIDRQTPFTAEQVYFDFHIGARDAASQRMEVELVAVPRAEVDAARSRAAGWGLEPDIVDLVGDDSGASPSINLLPGAETGRVAGIGGFTIVLTIIALALAAATVYLPLDRQRRTADLLTAEAERARAGAMVAARLRDEVAKLTKASAFLSQRRQSTPKAVELLDELTGLAPDHTWLQQLRIQEKEVRLTGLSGAASSLIGVIEQSPMFAEVRFRAPVTQDTRSGKERFTLSAGIVGAPKSNAKTKGAK